MHKDLILQHMSDKGASTVGENSTGHKRREEVYAQVCAWLSEEEWTITDISVR